MTISCCILHQLEIILIQFGNNSFKELTYCLICNQSLIVRKKYLRNSRGIVCEVNNKKLVSTLNKKRSLANARLKCLQC